MISKVTVKKYPKNLVEDTVADLWEELQTEYNSYLSNSSSSGSYYATLNDYIVAAYGEEYFPNGTAGMDAGMKLIAEETIKQRMLVYYIADAEGLTYSRKEKKEAYEARVAEMLDYYNSYYGTTGTANAFTVEDLESVGYTKDVIIDELVTERVYNFLYDAMKAKITYDPVED